MPVFCSWKVVPVHSVAESLGQDLGGDLLHRGERLARAVARGGPAVDLGRGVEVVVRHVDRPQGVADLAQRAERDAVSLAVQDVEVLDVLGLGPHAPLGLDHDLPDLAVEVEVVDVVAAEVGLEHGEEVGDRHVEAAGLGAVEVELELRHPGREGREDPGQLGPLAGLVLEPVDDPLQRLDALARAVLDHQLEAAGLAQAADRRRLEDHHEGVADLPASFAWSFCGQRRRPGAPASVRFDQSSSTAKTTPQLVWLVEVITFRPSSATVCLTPSRPGRSPRRA